MTIRLIKKRIVEIEYSDQFGDFDIHMDKSNSNYIQIQCDKGDVYIENRNHYCDRGRYIVKVFSKSHKFHIDSQDGFPRYYFDFDNMISEISSFLDFREVEIEKVIMRNANE